MKYYDLHTHTTHSDGLASVDQLETAAREKGYGLGVSDHLFCADMNTLDDVKRYLDDLEGRALLKGCEANIGEDYSMPDAVAKRFDYVIASVHAVPDLQGGRVALGRYFDYRVGESDYWENPFDEARSREYLETILPIVERTMATQRMDIYGHCTVLPFCETLAGTDFLLDWENALLSLCKKYGVAVELSGLWKVPDLDLVQRAKTMGLHFTMGSDCHIWRDLCNLDYAISTAEQAGLCEDDFFLPHRAE